MLEKDPLFEDDTDGAKTKEVRSAAYRAGQIAKERRFQLQHFRGSRGGFRGSRGSSGRGRGGFGGGFARGFSDFSGSYGGGYSSRGGYVGGFSNGEFPALMHSSAASSSAPVCFRCGHPGHYQKFCKAAQPASGQSR